MRCKAKTIIGERCMHSGVIDSLCLNHYIQRAKKMGINILTKIVGF